MYSYEVYQEEILNATEWFDAFDRLYGIRGRRIDFIRCNTWIRTPKDEYAGFKWKTEPGKGWSRPNRTGIIRGIISDLATHDPHFAWGISTRHCRASRALQLEWDFRNPSVPVDEAFLPTVINSECLVHLQARGINPHFIFTGGKSIHIAFYFARNIPNHTLWIFAKMVRVSLIAGGEPDAHSLYSGMRLPLSIHQERGALCRFANTTTPEQIVRYAESVQQDQVGAPVIIRAVKEWYGIHPELKPLAKTKSKAPVGSPDDQASNTAPTYDDSGNIDTHDTNGAHGASDVTVTTDTDNTPTLPTPLPTPQVDIVSGWGRYDDDHHPLISTSYALAHTRRDEYEEYLHTGIPCHQSWEIIRKSDFVFWTLHKLNSKQRVWDVLAKVLGLNVPEDVYLDRLQKLKQKLDFTPFIYTKPGQNSGSITLDEEEGAWIFDLSASLKRDFRADKAKGLLSIGYFLLHKLRQFGEANVGVREIADFLGTACGKGPLRKASEYLSIFRRGKYKIMEQVGDYKKPRTGKPGITRRFRRIERLPNLNITTTLPKATCQPAQSDAEAA